MKTKMRLKIEKGWVMGEVSTNKHRSECTFPVCTIKEYEEMTEEELLKRLDEAMWESEYVNLNF